jgi:hypothetical protein
MKWLRKWRRIYRIARIMSMFDVQPPIDITGFDLLDGRSEVYIDVTGIGRTDRVKPYAEKIGKPLSVHPGRL